MAIQIGGKGKNDKIVSGSFRKGIDDNSEARIEGLLSGPKYRFDGVNDDITIADDADIDIVTGDFSILIGFKPLDITRTTDYLLNKEAAGVGWGIYVNTDDIYLRLDDGTEDSSGVIATNALSNNTPVVLCITIDRDGLATAYINGTASGVLDVSDTVLTLASAGDLHIGNDSAGANEFFGDIAFVELYNILLTPAEAKSISDTAFVEYKYQGASQTELMPNTVDRDFSGASAWANVDVDAYDETGDLTITADTVDQYCTLEVASAPTTIGKKYIMSFDVDNIVGTWTIQSYDGTQDIGVVSADGTGQTLEWIAETTGGYRIVANAATSSADFDNFTLNSMGCLLDLNKSGVGVNQWGNSNTYDLNGVVTGAIPTNLPLNHVEQMNVIGAIAEFNFTLPKGYQVTSIVTKETGGVAIGSGIDIGTTDGGAELVSAHAVVGSATAVVTLIDALTIGGTFTTADDILYVTVTDASAWDTGAILNLYVTMERRVV